MSRTSTKMKRRKLFPSTDFEFVKYCDLCGGQNTKFFINTPDRNFSTGVFTYIQCQRCKLIWLSPRPKKQILDKYYPISYSAYKAIPKTSSLKQTFRNLIRKNYLASRLLMKDPLFFWKNKGKILDVGTGNGYYMQILADWGWQTYGVEINPDIVFEAKKKGIKNIRVGDLLTAQYKSNFFNVIRFSHVLEHVSSPRRELIEAKRILKRKGCVIISIPNIDSISFRIFRSYWYSLEAPRHFYHFSPKTIRKLLHDCGFIGIKIHFNQSPYPPLWSIMYFMGLKKIDKRNILFGYPFGLLLRIVNMFKKSDILEVFATKS